MRKQMARITMIVGLSIVGAAGAQPTQPTRPTKPAKRTPPAKPHAAKGGSPWDGLYVDESGNDHTDGLICPGDPANKTQYVVTNGMVSFDVHWIDREDGPKNGPRTFHVNAPLVQLDAKTVKKLSGMSSSMATATAKIPINPITLNQDGENKVFHEALLDATFSDLNPQGEDQAIVGTGRTADIRVTLGVADPVNGAAAACGSSRINSQSFKQNDFSKGNFCSQSRASCTWDAQCCSKSCSSEHHEMGVCN